MHEEGKVTLHIEVRLLPDAPVRLDSVARWVSQWLTENFISLHLGQEMTKYFSTSESSANFLTDTVEAINVVEVDGSSDEVLSLDNVELQIYAYKLRTPLTSNNSYLQIEDALDKDEQPVARVLELPTSQLDGCWEHLFYCPDIKIKLLQFISTIIFFSDKDVNFNCIGFNRLILLYGPPGSGKTSLCRALAQKLSIRLSYRYSRARLIEINAHTLCSKWFSESGKLVGRLFDSIIEMLTDEELFVLVLIDEIESLASAREAMSTSEPIDSLRVVNSLLTGLDRLRHKKNVIVLTTSNFPNAMDSAFLDRTDIQQFVGCPGPETCYTILRSCLNELIRCQIIEAAVIQSWAEASLMLYSQPNAPSSKLWNIAKVCTQKGYSGRALKKLPLRMHAEWIRRDRCTMEEALESLSKCVHDERYTSLSLAYDELRC
ncbi:P-loop containing nucleoside triphosphate hydrolase protein [Kalaharituber pfeilii]|nr:P-loop containing nucleoside triphosphate hydrolase protein [Kalaharituber pfeilii]